MMPMFSVRMLHRAIKHNNHRSPRARWATLGCRRQMSARASISAISSARPEWTSSSSSRHSQAPSGQTPPRRSTVFFSDLTTEISNTHDIVQHKNPCLAALLHRQGELGDDPSKYQNSSVNGRRSTLTSGESTTVQPGPNHPHDAWNLEAERRNIWILSHKYFSMHHGHTRKLESSKAWAKHHTQSWWRPCDSDDFVQKIIRQSMYHPSWPRHSASMMPMLSVWMVDGPIKHDKTMVKAHKTALLIVLCTSKPAHIVPWMARHGSSSLSKSRCTTNQPHTASRPETPSNESLIAMCSRNPSTFVSQSREASESHFCFQVSLILYYLPSFGLAATSSILWKNVFACISQDPTTSDIVLLWSLHSHQ